MSTSVTCGTATEPTGANVKLGRVPDSGVTSVPEISGAGLMSGSHSQSSNKNAPGACGKPSAMSELSSSPGRTASMPEARPTMPGLVCSASGVPLKQTPITRETETSSAAATKLQSLLLISIDKIPPHLRGSLGIQGNMLGNLAGGESSPSSKGCKQVFVLLPRSTAGSTRGIQKISFVGGMETSNKKAPVLLITPNKAPGSDVGNPVGRDKMAVTASSTATSPASSAPAAFDKSVNSLRTSGSSTTQCSIPIPESHLASGNTLLNPVAKAASTLMKIVPRFLVAPSRALCVGDKGRRPRYGGCTKGAPKMPHKSRKHVLVACVPIESPDEPLRALFTGINNKSEGTPVVDTMTKPFATQPGASSVPSTETPLHNALDIQEVNCNVSKDVPSVICTASRGNLTCKTQGTSSRHSPEAPDGASAMEGVHTVTLAEPHEVVNLEPSVEPSERPAPVDHVLGPTSDHITETHTADPRFQESRSKGGPGVYSNLDCNPITASTDSRTGE